MPGVWLDGQCITPRKMDADFALCVHSVDLRSLLLK